MFRKIKKRRQAASLGKQLLTVLGGIVGASLLLAAGLIWLWPQWLESRYQSAIMTSETVPAERVAIVFGAGIYNNGRLSGMLRDRMDTAIELYQARKVQKLLLSGDNRFVEYDEPGAMMDYAIAQGVPAADIQPDYAGRRTYDTCYRANAIFQVESAILVTQRFHLPRALFLCDQFGVQAVGVAADRGTYNPRSVAFSETREALATVAALFDMIRRAPPPVLGEPIPIQ